MFSLYVNWNLPIYIFCWWLCVQIAWHFFLCLLILRLVMLLCIKQTCLKNSTSTGGKHCSVCWDHMCGVLVIIVVSNSFTAAPSLPANENRFFITCLYGPNAKQRSPILPSFIYRWHWDKFTSFLHLTLTYYSQPLSNYYY